MLYLLLVFYICGALANDVPLVETSLGKVIGYHKESYGGRIFSAFEGIPYAEPPIGNLRFEAPKPTKPWSEILNATIAYTCKQLQNEATYITDSEDCLYLNIYIPKSQPSRNDHFDVIVYIHGGSFMFGNGIGTGPAYIMDRDVIYVTLNYRVGILGFLSTKDAVVPGNNGLKDQQLALKWIQEHAENFGGNPKSVTLMGESAGGASVHYHYFSQQSKGLFHRGMSFSGSMLMPWTIQEGALQQTKKLAVLLSCEHPNSRELINCLKEIPVDKLVAKTNDFFLFERLPVAPFAPVVETESESAFITKHPYNQLKNGEINDVPWLTWVTKDEGLFWTVALWDALDKINNEWSEVSQYMFDYQFTATEINKKEISDKIRSFYFKNDEITAKTASSLSQVLGDRLINIGYDTALQMHAKVVNSPVYAGVYGFDKESISNSILSKLNLTGVPHGHDVFILHDPKYLPKKKGLSKSEKYIKDLVLDFITSFVKDGHPTANGINWEPMTNGSFSYLYIRDVDDVKMVVNNNNHTASEFWESLDLLENSKAI